MNVRLLINQIRAEGVVLTYNQPDQLQITGQEAVVEKWTPELKVHKKAIIAELMPLPAKHEQLEHARSRRRQEVLAMLSEKPASTYAFLVETPLDADVVVAVGIRHLATFEMHIPKDRYNPTVFLRFLEGIKSRVTN